ncbi:MAG: class I SAM-dependent RNA methyltransferase [Nocardioidaceae bacterium]|nr:MAG: class I SAM-dependent RNA methyltransferase [Nocardioidaceae bacterium]
MTRRPKQVKGRSLVGETFEVEVASIAHGGHCVARLEGQVVFIRHALPGERVQLTVTEGGDQDRFLRADATTILTPSTDRVSPPCPYAGPGRCGGCDFQHASLPAQRKLKGQVVSEQLRRLAGIDREVVVEAIGGDTGLGWRTRMQWSYDAEGRKGLRRYRSHDVMPIQDCLLVADGARDGNATGSVVERVHDRDFTVAANGFWQVHPAAPQVLVDAVLAGASVQAGDVVVDLYAGVGLFSVFLAKATGPTGRVIAVEGVASATAHARDNLADLPWAEVVTGDVGRYQVPEADVVVLDPPRDGARRPVVESVVAASPRRVVYVACDPAALARDLGLFAEGGYELVDLRAFDLFPMTHHVECVAMVAKTGPVVT